MHQTTMRVTPKNRDALAKIAADELGGVSLDEALRVLVFEHDSRVALAEFQAENEVLAEVDVEVKE